MKEEMEAVKVTFARAGKVWWSIIWRVYLVSVGVFLVGSLVADTIPSDTVAYICGLIHFCLLLLVSIATVKCVLRKKYSDFRVALVEKDYQIKDKQQLGRAEMETVGVTLRRAFKVWWSLLWRTFLLVGLIIAAVESLFLGVAYSIGEEVSEGFIVIYYVLRKCVLYASPIFASIAVVQSVLRKKYSDFTIVLVEKDEQKQ